ncbi:MAG: SDR family oxidoreductase [Parvibaculum sp.]|uniref:SDR family oxidoreductase n=1 Tax=Parvibaculum sp. TaxID=2024848 RepID=UPI0032989144
MNAFEGKHSGGESHDHLEAVKTVAAAVLDVPANDLDPDEALGNLGFDSASLKLFSTRLSDRFDMRVNAVLLFAHPTLQALSAYIAQQKPGRTRPEQPEQARAEPAAPQTGRSRDIAIVGVACRLPGAASKEEFWANQHDARNCIREVPKRRWDWRALSGDPLRDPGRTDVRWGGFIEGEDLFAPAFFGISVYEAELMDPQHRLFLKTAWEAIWDAGYDPNGLAGRSVGVFAGVQFQDYQKLLDQKGMLGAQMLTGSAHAMVANRVSFLLDVHGPSEAIDTACSSSLVALHNAVRAIRNGECDLALAGGVNLLLTPDLFVMGRQLGVLSPTGQCRTFDAGADGYVRAEGVGVLVLKPFETAVRDRDHIYGVVKGTAVNHGGKAASLTAPNSPAQAALVMRALNDAKLLPSDISYVEMHGTGTELGDPIEMEGVKEAFRTLRRQSGQQPSACAVGSVKTNIGHLEPAAGVAGVINVLLSLKHGALPGLSNFRNLNPRVVLDDGFVLQAETGPWPANASDGARAAIVNSFGFGGANASVVVQQHVVPASSRDRAGEVFVPVAASDPDLLKAYAAALARVVRNPEHGSNLDFELGDIAFTLQQRNENRPARSVVRASSRSELLRGLDAIALGESPPGTLAMSGSTAGQTGPAHVVRWLEGGSADWPDIPEARRLPLPVSPWPDRSCWFEARPAEEDEDSRERAEMAYLQPGWRETAAGSPRPLDEKCIWVIGRDNQQIADFTPVLRGMLPPTARLVTSLIEGRAVAPQPSFENWNAENGAPDLIVVLPAGANAAEHADEVHILFELIKDLMERSFGRQIDIFHVARGDFGVRPADDALPALAKSAFLETERLRVHSLYFADLNGQDWRRLVALELAATPATTPQTIRYDGARLVYGLQPASVPERQAGDGPWFHDDGVYLFPGGAGELGCRLVERLLREVDATFVITGRSPLAGVVKDRVDALARKAGRSDRVLYVQCDIADRAQTQAMVADSVGRHGRLNGIVNLVTAHNDAYIYNKRWEDFSAVIASKVAGSVNLDLATAELDLDFIVAFSSLAALGFAGGADYAYACAFQNAFANWRNREVAAGRRRGRSYAVSWSRWKWDKYVTETVDAWFQSLGYQFMDADTGVRALRNVMAQPVTDILAMHGDRNRIMGHLDPASGLLLKRRGGEAVAAPGQQTLPQSPTPHATAASPATPDRHAAATEAAARPPRSEYGDLEGDLVAIVCELLKLDDLDSRTSLPSVGLDSVMAIRLIMLIEQRLSKSLSPKELLSNQTVAELAAHMGSTENRPEAAAAKDDLEEDLVTIVRELLKLDDLDPQTQLPSVGLDSVMAIRLIMLIEQRLSKSLSPKELLSNQTVAELAAHIRSTENRPVAEPADRRALTA